MPKLALPLNNSNINDPNIVFQWKPSSDPDGDSSLIRYCIVINEDSDPDISVYSGCDRCDFLNETTFIFNLESGKTYFWTVWAIDEDDKWSQAPDPDLGEWWCFTTLKE